MKLTKTKRSVVGKGVFCVTLCAMLFALCVAAPAQQPKINRIGVLVPGETWYEIVEGLPNPIVKDSFIEVWDRPGLGVSIVPEAAKQYLPAGDQDFFDD